MFFGIDKKSSDDGKYLHRIQARCSPHLSLFDNNTLLSSTERGSWNLAKPKLNCGDFNSCLCIQSFKCVMKPKLVSIACKTEKNNNFYTLKTS